MLDRENLINLDRVLRIQLLVRQYTEKVADNALENENKIKKAEINIIEIEDLLHDIVPFKINK